MVSKKAMGALRIASRSPLWRWCEEFTLPWADTSAYIRMKQAGEGGLIIRMKMLRLDKVRLD